MRDTDGRFVAILLLAVVGLAASIYLTVSHYRILSGQQLQGSFCQVSEVVDCDTVAASQYSDTFGVPWAGIGALVYSLMISLGLFGLLVRGFRSFSFRLIFAMAFLSILFDVYLAFVGFVVLKKVCLVCILTYMVNIGTLYYSKRGCGEGLREIARETVADLSLGSKEEGEKTVIKRLYYCLNGLIIVFGAMSLILLRWHYTGSSAEEAQYIMKRLRKESPVEVPTGSAQRLGNPQARIRIVEFSDFRCPYCKRMSNTIQILQKRFPDDVAVYFRNYPMDANCNARIQKTLHVDACKIAQLAICLQDRGLFWPLHDRLFSSDKHFVDNMRTSLEQRGFNPVEVFRCTSSPPTKDRLLSDIEDARRLGVEVTPTIFINGYKLVGSYNPATLSLIIEEFFLKENRSPAPQDPLLSLTETQGRE